MDSLQTDIGCGLQFGQTLGPFGTVGQVLEQVCGWTDRWTFVPCLNMLLAQSSGQDKTQQVTCVTGDELRTGDCPSAFLPFFGLLGRGFSLLGISSAEPWRHSNALAAQIRACAARARRLPLLRTNALTKPYPERVVPCWRG